MNPTLLLPGEKAQLLDAHQELEDGAMHVAQISNALYERAGNEPNVDKRLWLIKVAKELSDLSNDVDQIADRVFSDALE